MKGTIPYDDLYAKIAKTGKEVCNDPFDLQACILIHEHPADSLWNYDCLEGVDSITIAKHLCPCTYTTECTSDVVGDFLRMFVV